MLRSTRGRILSAVVNLTLMLGLLLPLSARWTGLTPVQAQADGLPSQDHRVSYPNAAVDQDGPLQVLSSDLTGITLELATALDAPQTVSPGDEPCTQLSVPGFGWTGQPAWPQVPVYGAMIGVPPDAELTLRLEAGSPVVLDRRYDVCPVPSRHITQELDGRYTDHGEVWTRAAEAYATPGFWPEPVAEIAAVDDVRDLRVAQLRFQPVQVDASTGQVRYYPKLRIRIAFEGAGLRAAAMAAAEIAASPFEQTLERTLLNYEVARAWRVPPSAGPETEPQVAASASAADIEAYKVIVDQDGIYELTYAELQEAGVPVATLDPRLFYMESQGDPIAIRVLGEDDGSFDPTDKIIFYGRQNRTRYTDENVYWLAWEATDPRRMADSDGEPASGTPLSESFWATARWEQSLYYQSLVPAGSDHWFGSLLQAYNGPVTATLYLTLTNVATTPYSATLTGLVYGYSQLADVTPDHHTRLYVNDHLVDDVTWEGQRNYAFDYEIPHTYLVKDVNRIQVELPWDPSEIPVDSTFVNWFAIRYQATYITEVDLLDFNVEETGARRYRVSGFSHAGVEVYDITNPLSPTRLTNFDVTPNGSEFDVLFQAAQASAHHYVALTTDRYLQPVGIKKDTPSDLHATSNAADYIVITHRDFYTSVLPLVDHRAAQGLRTAIVDVQDIYDEFNGGVLDPEAIHSFLAYAYQSWQSPAPVYVMLVGDGHYDFKDYLGRHEPIFIPPYLADVDQWVGEVASDNRYVTVAGQGRLPDMSIGRLPVATIAQAEAMVDKIIAYEVAPLHWRTRVLFAADNPDDSGDFHAYADAVADNYVPDMYSVDKVYLGQNYSTGSAVKAALLAAINEGRLIVNYTGHGSIQFWAAEHILDLADIRGLTNGDQTPFMVSMTCLDGYFIHPSEAGHDSSSFGESIVRAAGKGAIASWSSSGNGLVAGHDYLNRGLYEAIFAENIVELGPATTYAKLYLAANPPLYHDLIDNYILFGDPATRLGVLPADVRITQTAHNTGTLYPGDAITYTLSYENLGPGRAIGVVISDTLPAAVSNPVVTSSGPMIAPRPGTAYTWFVGDLAFGQGGVITVTGEIGPGYTGTVVNVAAITTTVIDPEMANNQSTTTVLICRHRMYLPAVSR